MAKKFGVVIVPNSEEEHLFLEVSSFEEAKEIHESEDAGGLYYFDTEKERECFLQGYHAGIGYLGDGVNIKSN